MESLLRFAAIDIGSNGVRLLLSGVYEEGYSPTFRKMSLIRMPIRLGDDAFTQKHISDRKVSQLVKSMIGFKHLIEAFQPLDMMACATSAMRAAENGQEICDQILAESDIKIDIIDGVREAEFIFQNKSADMFGQNDAYLYVDIGGGSTDITLFSRGRIITTRSFNIGTIRLLEGLVTKSYWKKMKQWLKNYSAPFTTMAAIGSGGNINKVFRLANCKNGRPLTEKKMIKVRRFLEHFTVEERIKQLALRPDRADVIIPALDIYLKIMKWSGIRAIYVPQVGLADGIIHILYDRYKVSQSEIKNTLPKL
ncbi:MAG: exopolyphosphatase [Desulfobacterales bacterium]|jgi:exopolyphosphatase/guanosine-5'-triphosphate,3'-diphosphate pyrophosphatase